MINQAQRLATVFKKKFLAYHHLFSWITFTKLYRGLNLNKENTLGHLHTFGNSH